ncbi:CDP-glycerol glycerophosphotransferase family protein [Proteus terrae]|uniref:CDP-glycerol glycerophosphotransferase family protein n=1 Tax=Proteus terrae TaxID=1574161 RepID=UPI0032DBC3E3
MSLIKKIFLSFIILFKIIISFLIYPFFSKKYRNTIIIGTRNGEPGYDNGEILFEYLQKKGEKDYFLIYIKPEPGNKNILKKNTIKSILRIISSKYIYITHSESDVLSYLWRFFRYKKYIFIQHGVIGIKYLPEYQKKSYFRYISSNHYETEIFLNHFKIKKDKIIQSGLPRFDKYLVKKENSYEINSCLIMFTWRKNKKCNKINYNEIISKLKKENPRIKIYITTHNMSQELDDIIEGASYVKNTDLPYLIKNTDLLVTDYSSISWDYLYQNKYIWFYHYDHNSYIKNEGTYCQFDSFFGYRSYAEDIISIDNITNKIIINNIANNPTFLKRNYFYLYNENNHINTLLQEVKKYE